LLLSGKSDNTLISAREGNFLPTLLSLYGILAAPIALGDGSPAGPLGVISRLRRRARADMLCPPFPIDGPHLVARVGWRTRELPAIGHFHGNTMIPGLFRHRRPPLPKHCRRRLDPITGFRFHGDNRVGVNVRPLTPLPCLFRIIGRIVHRSTPFP